MTNRKPERREVNTTVRVPAEVHDQLREIAQREERTVSAEVRLLILRHVAADREREGAAA
jgi:predicted DNA-binding protein